jgi:hypothetical protein
MCLQTIFKSLENEEDIFIYIHDWIPTDNNEYFVCYKIWCEYGVNIIISDIQGNKLNHLFVNDYKDETFSSKDFYISSSTYFGLSEKIYSNRTEYYICDNYYSNNLDDNLIMYIKLINKYLLEDTDLYGDELYNFIKSDKLIDFLPNTIFVNIPENALICDTCHSQIIPIDNQCDFCDRKMCENCKMNSYYSFHKCDKCETKYCYYDSLNADYRCLKIPKSCSSNCGNCGL